MSASARRPRVFYVSYDGMAEPLGRSQVLNYLFRLAGSCDITLFSFEKPGADRAALTAELADHGIHWVPLSYHKRPPLISTLLDAVTGARAVRALARKDNPDIVHVRSYVPALIAMWARRVTRARLVFDIRGFWADERVEGGIWPSDRVAYRAVYRLTKACERWFFRNADAVVTLTDASVPQIRAWAGRSGLDVVVIPTCVDLDRFTLNERREDGRHLTWCGSIGTWYRFDLVAPLAERLGFPLHVITRQTELAIAGLGGAPAEVESLAPRMVPGALHAGDVGLSLCLSSFSKIASAPTRFAEYLAAGMPVIVNPGIGDLERIVEQHRVGVVLRGEESAAFGAVAEELRALLSDPELAQRCRAVARELFDVDAGSRRYRELYDRVLAP
jgi:glycosyltransferase involved in cell wall biosynthesis